MNQYISQLFQDENTVIIPGFGALTMVNRSTNELMFMSYLKLNDGVLMRYIVQQENCSHDEAKAKMDAFVATITETLENGQSFPLPPFGAFSKDAQGEVVFTSSNQEDTDTVSTLVTEQTVTTSIVEETTSETPFEPSTPIVEVEIPEIEEKSVEEQVTNEEVVIEQPINEIVDFVSQVDAEEPKIIPATEEEQWNDDLDLPPLNYQPERPKKAILEKTKKDKKARRGIPIWIMLLAFILIGGITYVGLNFEKFFGSTNQELVSDNELLEDTTSVIEQEEEVVAEQEEQIEENTTSEVEEATMQVEEVVETAPVPEPTKTQSTPSADASKPIQVIVGSFGVEANAQRLAAKVNQLGFTATVIPQGSIHLVSAGSFSSMEELNAQKEKLSTLGNYWIKK